jgi:ADP-dependent NAD(P)H-hydrate dehydratase / NAD(P)H-hydrate epimerase
MPASHSIHKRSGITWTSDACQSFDRYLQSAGIPAACLMEQAARSISDFLLSAIPDGENSQVLFLCGPGNNGADAVAAARQLLFHPRLKPAILLLGGPPAPQSLLQLQVLAYQNLGGEVLPSAEVAFSNRLPAPTILVDALFGVGLQRPLAGNYAEVVNQATALKIPVLAVDCPSGLNCDDGTVLGCCLPATWTLSFIGYKRGFLHHAGPALCGEVRVADIGVRSELAESWLALQRRDDD